jgi:hypothetical protein
MNFKNETFRLEVQEQVLQVSSEIIEEGLTLARTMQLTLAGVLQVLKRYDLETGGELSAWIVRQEKPSDFQDVIMEAIK